MTQPRRSDEVAFYAAMRTLKQSGSAGSTAVFALVESLGMNEKRAAYLLGKWTGKRWWDYGVSLFSGWFTPQAPLELKDKSGS